MLTYNDTTLLVLPVHACVYNRYNFISSLNLAESQFSGSTVCRQPERQPPVKSSKNSEVSYAHSCKRTDHVPYILHPFSSPFFASSPAQSSPVQSPGFVPSPILPCMVVCYIKQC